MSYDAIKVRAAVEAFLRSTGLKAFALEKKAGIAEGTLRAFRSGRTHTMTDESFVRLAVAASEILGRRFTAAMIKGEEGQKFVPITSRIGAGERVIPVEGDHPLSYQEVPAKLDISEGWQVDGDSMRPLYGPRDLIFPSRKRREPAALIGRIVGAQIKTGPRLVKLLQRGSRKNRFDLASINQAHATLEDQQLEWVALIAFAIYAD